MDKHMILDFLWQYSKYHYQRLWECEELYNDDKGYAALFALFVCFENIAKSVVDDYDSTFFNIVAKVKSKDIISEDDYLFINEGEYCIRRIRNLFAHANIASIYLCEIENGREIFYPLSEDDSCLLLYRKISNALFIIILKMISTYFLDDIKSKIANSIEAVGNYISDISIDFRILDSKEMLLLNGFPETYFGDLDISEEEIIRLISNAGDINAIKYILSNIVDINSNESQ